MLELKFHTKDYPYFYEADGVTLKEEPDESLDDLLDAHKEMCNDITKLAQLEYDIDLKILHINEREQLIDWTIRVIGEMQTIHNHFIAPT